MRSGGNRSLRKCKVRIRAIAAPLMLALLLVLPALSPLRAQHGPVPASGSKPATAAGAPISAGQAEQLLDVLNDPKKRAAFTSTLTAMVKSLPATAPAPAPKIALAPGSLGRQLLGEAGTVRRVVIAQTTAFGSIFGDMMLATHWLNHELSDPVSRATFWDVAWRGTIVILVALLAERGLLLLLRRALRTLARDSRIVQEMAPNLAVSVAGTLEVAEPPPKTPQETPKATTPDAQELPLPTVAAAAAQEAALPHEVEKRVRDATHRWKTLRLLRRVPFALLRLLLRLLPVGLFLVIGNFVGGSLADHPVTQLVIVTVTNLYGLGRVLYLVLEMLLAPYAPGARLVGVSDSTAVLLIRWWAWLVAVPVAATILTDVGSMLDLPEAAGQSMIRFIVLIEHVLLGGLIWRLRHRVADALTPPRRIRTTAVGMLLSRMAQRWWIAALFFDFALWLVWAAQVRDGYGRIWRVFVVTCIVAFGCRLVGAALLGLLDRLFHVNPELELRYPGLERRANRYYPLLRGIVNAAVLAVGAIVLLQAWGLHVVDWFTSGALGTRLVSALISILIALVIGVAVWEAANAALDRQIARFGVAAQVARAVRLRTLLPILRTVLFIVLATIISLTVLNEIGVNVAPLLAGAGILGVAIGFGSQKLVQDFITGIFLLVENAMQVGDTVTAAGVTGTVEHLSIRTLRLRGGDGSVQIIPFSSVSTVVNLSRDFAVAAIAISVSVAADTDRICDLMKAIGDGLRGDNAFAASVLENFSLNGVDSIGEYAVAISGTIKCTVDGRWPVQREFYRRLRMALQEQHVVMPAGPLAFPWNQHEATMHG